MRLPRLFVFLLFSLLWVGQSSAQAQSLRSDFKDKHFITNVTFMVDAPYADLCRALDELYVGMKTSPTRDCSWVWKNLGKSKSTTESDLKMEERGVFYNPINGAYLLKMAVGVSDDPSVYNVEGFLKCGHYARCMTVDLDITKKIKILNDASFHLVAVPHGPRNSVIRLESRIRFGWLFNTLFTKSRYESIMEWRIAGVAHNIKTRAEGYYQEQLQKSRSSFRYK